MSVEGEVLSSNNILLRVEVESQRALIQPQASDGDTNLVFLAWATSPFRRNEWIIGGVSRTTNDIIENVFIGSHPVFGAHDTYANLGRILYLPSNHPACGIEDQERYYIPIETSSYQMHEVNFEADYITASSGRTLSRLTAHSPPYFYISQHGRNAPQPFRGTKPTRRLWTISVTDYTNWLGRVLPSRFTYVRWQDPQSRAMEQEDRPIVLISGELISIESGANADIRSRLARSVSVADVRTTAELGRAIRYTTAPGAWPEIGSPQYQRMVETNRIRLATTRLDDRPEELFGSKRLNGWVKAVFIAFCLSTLALIVWVHIKTENKGNNHETI
jgi:hypothetical protein